MKNRFKVSTYWKLDGSMTNYTRKGAVVATPSGRLVAIPLDGDNSTADVVQEGVQPLIRSSGGPEGVLDYLFNRMSTVTMYSKPITLVALDATEAAKKAAQREDRA